MKLAFIDFVFEQREAIQLEGFEIQVHPPLASAGELIAAAHNADVLLMRDQFGQVTAGVLDACPRLKLIVTRSAGYDHIDLEAARARGVVVCNVPDYGAHMIAEHAFGLMLAVARNICRGHNRYRKLHRFDDTGLGGVELYGKTLGVIGTGRIGRHSIRIGTGFGMRVLAFDVLPDQVLAAELGFQYRSLDEVLANSDFVTLHVPLIEGTRHLIGSGAL
ncbi:MAG: NAD(P)-dependent oxidoreductase, partial [Anaerolineae bacterium]